MGKIGILNYGLGNVGSMLNAVEFYKHEAYLIEDEAGLDRAEVIIMCGVGNFKAAMAKLTAGKWIDKLEKQAIQKQKPILGVCLGMQLFASQSEEGGTIQGLGWIPGSVVKMTGENLRIPHMGWNDVKPVESPELFKGMRASTFYFMHGYHFKPEHPKAVLATTQYGDLEVVSAIRKDNIVGVQFHPEKSQGDGLRFMRNFLQESLN